MTSRPSGSRVRIVLEFERVDQPRLFDDLMRFPKGPRRVNRLRLLAQEGMTFERLSMTGTPSRAPSPPSDWPQSNAGDASLTDDIFRSEG